MKTISIQDFQIMNFLNYNFEFFVLPHGKLLI